MTEQEQRPIIVIKRIIKKGGHHGGSWKLAYADFVTAMMAFFLLLWLLSLMDQNKLQGISNYFKKPMRDLFIENQLHDTNIPKIASEATMKSELSPLKMDLDKRSLDANKANTEAIQSSTIKNPQATKLKMVNTPSPTASKNPQFDEDNGKEKDEIRALKKNLTQSMRADPVVQKYQEHIDFKISADGLKINIKALKGRPMFAHGDINFTQLTRDIMKWLAKELNRSSKKITIIGHTDSSIYNSAYGVGNWELSADRANATRSYLLKNGLKKDKIIRVQGAADMNLYDKHNSESASNRRIEIILLNKKAEKILLSQ